jgi:hypothetical protein
VGRLLSGALPMFCAERAVLDAVEDLGLIEGYYV